MNGGLRFDEQQSKQDVLVFVGAAQSFSNAFLRTIAAEFSDLEPVRLSSARELLEYLKVTRARPRLVVVDAPVCAEFGRNKEHSDCKKGGLREETERALCEVGAPVAVTYWDADSADLAHCTSGVFSRMCGYVPMNQSLDIWLSVLRLLISGGSYYPAEIGKSRASNGQQPIADVTPRPDPETQGRARAHAASHLTPREEEVIQLVVTGMQNKQIAAALELSSHTVKLHMHHIIAKLGATNRTEAAIRYLAVRSG